MSGKDQHMLRYGNEEGDFYLHHVVRTMPFEQNNHYHSTYEIYYLLSGRRYYFIKDESCAVAPGDLVLINKYDVHKTSGLGSPQHERFVMNFSDAFLGEGHPLFDARLLDAFRQPHHLYRLKPQQQWAVEELFRQMADEVTRQEDGFELALRLLTLRLLLLIARLGPVDTSVTNDPLSPTRKKIAEVVKCINANYDEKQTLPELADAFGMSPSYLSRTFKKVTGFTVSGYRNLTRIRAAQQLLTETDAPAQHIAEQVGFDHYAHFSRMFRHYTGTHPQRYRQQNK